MKAQFGEELCEHRVTFPLEAHGVYKPARDRVYIAVSRKKEG